MKTDSEFLKWFIEQHGTRCKRYSETDSALVHIGVRGEWAKKELEARKVYDARMESALYAWNARTK